MLKLTNLRLRRSNVVLNSFGSRVTNATEEFSRAPEMPFSKMISNPRVFFKKLEGAVSFKQLKSFANTHGWRHLDKQMDMVNSEVEFINFEPFSVSYLPQKELAIHPKPVELERIFGIFNFPGKMESILPEAMFSGFQIHFSSPKPAKDKTHANLTVYFEEPSVQALPNSKAEELNLSGDGDSSPSLKTGVSSPWM